MIYISEALVLLHTNYLLPYGHMKHPCSLSANISLHSDLYPPDERRLKAVRELFLADASHPKIHGDAGLTGPVESQLYPSCNK